MFWTVTGAIVLFVLAVVGAGVWAARHYQAKVAREDRRVLEHLVATRGGVKPPNAAKYDEAKAIAGAQRARQQSATGRTWVRPKRRRRATIHRIDRTAGGVK